MKLHHDTFPTPVGDFSVAFDAAGGIHATAFGGRSALQSRIPRGHELASSRPAPAIRQAVAAYFRDGTSKLAMKLEPQGSVFQQKVWTELLRIPPGKTRTYGDIARRLGSSPRAVGRANATNPICLFIPCHRVIGADGTLTGYAFGQPIKQRLLAHEGALGPALT
ncbi:MAG: methylated-DNA--[protein]-cysteine S-methyltransferase [Opitutaceae bacterium]|nr:methylated-DNA--[protein]-cysteine S-methyltransferase [Opitutaceae bacterium]